jgi:hypothetical protein
MASSGKKKTTMAKLNRESRMRERRLDKQARRDARRQAAAAQPPGAPIDTLADQTDESAGPDAPQPAVEAVVPALADA